MEILSRVSNENWSFISLQAVLQKGLSLSENQKWGYAPEQHSIASLGSGQAQRLGLPSALAVHKCWKLGVTRAQRL